MDDDNIASKTMSGVLSSIISTSDMNARRTEEESDSNSSVVSFIVSFVDITVLLSSDFESEELWGGQNRHLTFLGRGLPSLSLDCKQSLVA